VGLTRESRSDDIHCSTPGLPVETFDVIPDGSGIEGGRVISEPLLDELLTVFVPFDVADCLGSESSESEREGEPAVPGEEGQLS
jgi:hypothetical protein